MDSIIQWNCRGLRANFDEIQLLTNNFTPLGICLQETMQNNNILNLRKYSHFYCNSVSRDGRAIGGVSLLILKTVPHSVVNITTNLQAVAVRVTLHRAVTLCSIYLPPTTAINSTDLMKRQI